MFGERYSGEGCRRNAGGRFTGLIKLCGFLLAVYKKNAVGLENSDGILAH